MRWGLAGGSLVENGVLAVDRILVPAGAPEILRYFSRRLFVSHGMRERISRMVMAPGGIPWAPGVRHRWGRWDFSAGDPELCLTGARSLPSPEENPDRDGKPPQQKRGWGRALPLLRQLVHRPELLEMAGIGEELFARSVLIRDDAPGRPRVLVFPFPEGSQIPRVVIKLQNPALADRSLDREWQALNWVRSRTTDDGVKASVPEGLAFERTPEVEILVLSHVEGRSVYWEQRNRFFVRATVEDQMEAASDWLVGFQRALGLDASEGVGPSHGDYWARNLLLAYRGNGTKEVSASVVDWEHFDPRGRSQGDLFHFAITYAHNYPWRLYRRLPLPDAFRLGFMERTSVSRAMSSYFSRYCTGTGLHPRNLEDLLRHHLRVAATEKGNEWGEPWVRCLELLDRNRPVALQCDP